MIRGTTPALEFSLPFDSSHVKKMSLVFSQKRHVVIEKSLSDVEWTTEGISLLLTQEETLSFDPDELVAIQIRIVTDDDQAVASDIITTRIGDVLRDGKI
jgi:hypothetical protein